MSQGTTIAAKTKLPPSPESTPYAAHHNEPIEPSRLRSIAKYGSFKPQALACSLPVASSYTEVEQYSHYASKGAPKTAVNVDPLAAASLGAIAGSHGVALFRITRPETPLMIFSLGSSVSNSSDHNADSISSLSFQQSSFSNSFHLAAAKGASALVWDASGHSTNPLRGRLRVDSGTGTDFEACIKSLVWKPNSELLAGATASTACLWDLRESSTSASLFKPSLRFGVSRRSGISSPNVQLACSEDNECAIIDAAGRLRVFDIRKTDRGRADSGALYSVAAFQHAGIGVSYFPTEKRSTALWMTWGLDDVMNDAAVRIWTSADAASELGRDADEYWYMEGASDPKMLIDGSSAAKYLGCQLIGQCTVSRLACARVNLSSMKDSFVTVAFNGVDTLPGWKAEVWKLRKAGGGAKESLQSIFSFSGGNESKTLGLADTTLGAVCAAELGVVTRSATATAPDAACSELMMCCLSDRGFVTTHVIPEAVNDAVIRNDGSRFARFDNATPLRIFPSDNEAPLLDAARNWGKRDSDIGAAFLREESGTLADPIKSFMPFDMDISSSYAGVGSRALPEGVNGLEKDKGELSANERSIEIAREAAILMSKIEKDRIPCPRLCGATFGPGVGGLALFHNGGVRKMWRWWDKDTQTRLAAAPPLTREIVPHARKTGEGSPSHPHQFAVSVTRACPRSLQDLMSMIAAAKNAQWGDQDDSDASSMDDFRLLTGKYFDDDGSDGSSGSFDDSTEVSESHTMYDSYFSEAKRPLVADSSSVPLEEALDDNLSPTSDMLSPSVCISYNFDVLAFNNQSKALAEGWKIGSGFLGSEGWDENTEVADTPKGYEAISVSQKTATTLPRYRFLVPLVDGSGAPRSSDSLSRLAQNPLVRQLNNQQPKHNFAGTGFTQEEDMERGVHGGEYSVRPNMQESMVFLKKLFTQQPKDDAAMFSPPDSPMLPNSLSNRGSGRDLAKRMSMPNLRYSPQRTSRPQVGGVSVLRAINPDPESRLSRVLLDISETCLHNASVSESLGENSKRDTWKLLAKAVESRVRCHNAFSGDWGRSGDALGTNLVRYILRYYESLKDVQMLATIVCVLRHPIFMNHPAFKMLPAGPEEHKYDVFIKKYADLLYLWNLLTTRAELTKHLARVPPEDDENRSPGVSLVLSCPRCAKEIVGAGTYCESCRNFAFRCVICDTAVRGLFTICDACGHGGHVRHLTSWFALHEECPTGCGCLCVMRPAPSLGQQHVATGSALVKV
ncbi:hypothetical protein MPSEU_000959500 [Mayamaea pseudoterrestris]|nr:hypothetical protein MPSEU_000959500 [Mayamaea pseudoterrestris]